MGAEVLMGLRGAGHRFMPNRLVFPGGAVEKQDGAAPAASEPDAGTLAMLGRSAGPKLARALVVAAARELEEETGLTFGAPPRLHAIHYLCRAVTPPRMPMRFNARFLVAEAGTTQGKAADSRELEGLRFYGVEEALALDIMLVTREVLQRLLAWLAMDDAARRARQALAVFKERSWRSE